MIRLNHLRGRIAPALLMALGLGLALPGLVSTVPAQAPGPESFAKPPKTPLEFWDAADYLIRTGQAPLAVPYLNGFLKANPTDQDLLAVREKYGAGSVLRLDDDPATRPLARPILDRINAAVKRAATDPDRMRSFIDALSQSREEQDYGVDRLKEAGPYAIPPLVKALENPSLSRETRSLIVTNMGRLDRAVVPALVSVLGVSDPAVAADAARALGLIRDPRAVPFLTFPAARPEASSLREAARAAIEKITGRPFAFQPKAPVRVLADEAWKYHRHQVRFDGNSTEVWVLQDDVPTPLRVPPTAAESIFGARFAREALALDPSDRSAQVAFASLALEKVVEREGIPAVVSRDPTGAFAAATAAGPEVVADVLKTAIRDGHYDLAAAAALALGRVADRDANGTPDAVSPLVAALSAPDRRVQYAAARALVEMNPSRPFVGSSRVVPTLARFITNRSFRALVVDGNINRGNSVASTLKRMNYDARALDSREQAFRQAAEAADVELILVEPTVPAGAWDANDLLTNLRADARTAGIPVLLYGPLDLRDRLGGLLTNFPKVDFVVTPTDPAVAGRTMDPRLAAMGTRPLTPAERDGFAQDAAGLLATIASRPNSPFAADLAAAEPALAEALNVPAATPSTVVVLADVPGAEAQRSLARVLLDPARPGPLRFEAGRSLSRSIQRFGPLLTPEQETRIVSALDAEPDASVKGVMSSVYGALRPSASAVGRRLQAYQPSRPPAPARPAAPAAAPAGAATPPAEAKPAEPSTPPPAGDAEPKGDAPEEKPEEKP